MLPIAWQQQQHTTSVLQQLQQRGGACSRSRCVLQLSASQSRLRTSAARHNTGRLQDCSYVHQQMRTQRPCVSTAVASISSAILNSHCSSSGQQHHGKRSSCCRSLMQLQQHSWQRLLVSRRQQRQTHLTHAAGQPPDPWQQSSGTGSTAAAADWGGSSGGSSSGRPPEGYGPPGSNGGNGRQPSPTGSYDAWDAVGSVPTPGNGMPRYERTDWGWSGVPEDWDPAEGLAPEQLADMERDYLEQLQRRRASQDPPRDKWITPLLDWQSISGAFDPDQSRTEDAMADEALTNKEESREALAFIARLVVIPLITGALISRAITDPVLSFSLQNNPNAFAISEHQKLEGAQALHMEETRVKMMMAIGQIPPMDEAGMLQHLHEFALEFQEEEREKNEASLMTLVSDSISAMVFFIMFVRDNDARQALFSTIGRLFEGLSDIAKAVLIILVADTLLGYHSEEGWTGFLDLFLGHYGIEVEEENIVLFVGIIPIAIDVLFKYWIFIGLNKISPGAVVTIKQLDRH